MSDPEERLNYRALKKAEAATVELVDTSAPASMKCIECGHINSAGSNFCTECGSAITGARHCPSCHSTALPGADICEGCGTWLLRGRCKFCLADVAEDDAFCGTCGNPQAGITCPRCGSLSIFDFCRNCAIPLSREGSDQLARTRATPCQEELLAALQEIAAIDERNNDRLDQANGLSAIKEAEADQLLQMRMVRERAAAGIAQVTDKVMQRKALFSADQREQIGLLGDQIKAEEERKRHEAERLRIEEERRRKVEEERRRRLLEQVAGVLREMSAKTFPTSQAARRYYMGIVSALPEEARQLLSTSGSLRWRCNFANVEHADPGECGDPSQGGVWLVG